jgi:hypothetical protein
MAQIFGDKPHCRLPAIRWHLEALALPIHSTQELWICQPPGPSLPSINERNSRLPAHVDIWSGTQNEKVRQMAEESLSRLGSAFPGTELHNGIFRGAAPTAQQLVVNTPCMPASLSRRSKVPSVIQRHSFGMRSQYSATQHPWKPRFTRRTRVGIPLPVSEVRLPLPHQTGSARRRADRTADVAAESPDRWRSAPHRDS